MIFSMIQSYYNCFSPLFFVNFLIKFCFLKILLESVKYIRYNVLVYTLRKCAAKPTAYMRGMDL